MTDDNWAQPSTKHPGWYPDETERGVERYWDGTAWTERIRWTANAVAHQEERSTFVAKWVGAGLLAALIILVGAALTRGSDDGPSDGAVERTAKRLCHAEVESRLKSPSSAEYSGEAFMLEDNAWALAGSVDADNSFGASLRSEWTCGGTVDGDTVNLLGFDLADG